MLWELAIVVALILFNGVFAMSELAVVSSRRTRLKQMASTGSAGARAALKLIEDPTPFLSTVQIGITLIGVLAGAYSGAVLAEPLAAWLSDFPQLAAHAHTTALTLVVVGITYLSLVVGELVPKRIALSRAEAIAALVARPMSLLARFGGPLVWLLRVSTEAALRILRIPKVAASTVTEEEVKALISEGTEAGVFHAAEREMIEGVLRLAERPVTWIMTPRVDMVWIGRDDDAETIRKKLAATGHSRFPVGSGGGDDLDGVVRAKDLLEHVLGGNGPDVQACLRQPLVVHERTPVLRLLEMFRTSPVHIAIVVDEYGSIEGLVTATDIFAAIAGDLPGEHEATSQAIVRRDDGSWLIDGMATLDDVERVIERPGMKAAHSYHTIAGFVLWHLGHVPAVGEAFEWNGVRFEVVDMDGRRIDRVLLSVIAPPGGPQSDGDDT